MHPNDVMVRLLGHLYYMARIVTSHYKVETTRYLDIYENVLWSEPMVFKRLWMIGQTFIENYIKYKIVRVAISGKFQIVNVEIV